VVALSRIPRFLFFCILLTACSKGHFGKNCNHTCDGCISELCNRFDGECIIQDVCKAGWHGVKCDKGTCIILYKYSWTSGKCINKFKKEKKLKKTPLGNMNFYPKCNFSR
jgi:hypothetical protein